MELFNFSLTRKDTNMKNIKSPTARMRYALAAAVALAVAGTVCAGTKIYVSSTSVTMPAGWNACSLYSSASPKVFKNLVDSTGSATDVSLFLMSPANGYQNNIATQELTGDAAEFEVVREATTIASYHVAPGKSSTHSEPNIRARFTGLDPSKLYEFSFMASCPGGAGADWSERYTVIGANSATCVFNPAGNTTKVARVTGIAPLPDGSVEFTLAAAESNAHVNKAAYISALKVEELDSLPSQEIYVDAYNSGTEPRTAHGISWNAATLNVAGVTMSQLVDSKGNVTPVSLVSTKGKSSGGGVWNMRLNGASLTGDAAVFMDAVDGDSNQSQACLSAATDVFKATVSGLYPNCTYTFTFFASYSGDKGSGNDKKVVYSVAGETSGSSVLDTWQNTSNVATIAGIRPNEDGTVEISYRKDDGANNYNYAYLAAFRISRDTIAAAGEKPVFVSATSGGGVSATVDGAASPCERYLAADKILEATATPDAGYKFVGWTSSWTNETVAANPFPIPATQAATWTAVFEKDAAYAAKTMYVDAYGTPTGDGKTWNSLGDNIFGYGEWQGPFLASDGTSAAVAFKTVCPFGRKKADGTRPVNKTAGLELTGDAAEFNAARGSAGDQLYMQIDFNSYTNRAIVAFDVYGLKPRCAYTLRFMSTTTSDRYYELLARCVGENTVSASVNPVGNATKVAKCANVRPDANGVIRVEISSAPQNAYDKNGMLVCFTAFSIEGDISETDAKHILWFGNSFSGNGDIPGRVADLAELAGFARPVIVKSIKNGSALAYHVGTVTNSPKTNILAPEIVYMTGRNWDDVVIQGRMLEAASATAEANGYPAPSEGFVPLATNLYALVRASAKGDGVRGVLYQTWPYADGASSVYPSLYATPAAMHEEIAGNYSEACSLINSKWGPGSAVVALVGDAYRKAGFAQDFYHTDLYHQGGKYGYEFAAIVLFNRIYGVQAKDCLSYGAVAAAGLTSLTGEEWNWLATLAARVEIHGMIIVVK